MPRMKSSWRGAQVRPWQSKPCRGAPARSAAGVNAFLLDEMFPPAAAVLLREKYGHDAVHVFEAGLQAADDAQVAVTAHAEGRAVVTGNVADLAAERDVTVVFVLKKNLPAGGGQAAALADALDRWAHDHPHPYLGPHWPCV